VSNNQLKQIFFPLLAAVSSFSLILAFSAKGELTQQASKLLGKPPAPQPAQNSDAKANGKLVAQKDQAFRNAIAKLEQEVKENRLTFNIPKQFKSQVLEEVKLNNSEKVVALTFDDGPWPDNTTQILDVLRENNIKATFFVVGQAVQAFPQLLQQVVKEGHAIGNHTWSHSYHNFSPEGAKNEIERTAAIVYETTGVKTSLFRPPGGFMHNGVVDYAKQRDYAIVMWSADSNDYRRPPVPTFLHSVLSSTGPGGIILMHDGGGDRTQTVKALPELIADLKQQGYRFVTVAELLKMREKENQTTTATQPPNADANSQAKISQKN
jgi:chitin deacetylase